MIFKMALTRGALSSTDWEIGDTSVTMSDDRHKSFGLHVLADVRICRTSSPRSMKLMSCRACCLSCECRLIYATLFGGVVSMKPEMFVRVNGFSLVYFGWGGEDDDMGVRYINSCCLIRKLCSLDL